MNYFELYEIPLSFKVEKAFLARRYFELQKRFHPDYFSQGTETEQSEALELSSQVNRAFRIFTNEEETIKYVLQLKGLLEEEEKYQLSTDFLMEMMELNETLSENSKQEISELVKKLYAEVSPIIENFNEATTSTADLLSVKEYYYKKKYLQRILDRTAG